MPVTVILLSDTGTELVTHETELSCEGEENWKYSLGEMALDYAQRHNVTFLEALLVLTEEG